MTTIEIVQGDSVAGMRKLESESVDVAVTSPPYNVGAPYRTYADRRGRSEYLEWCLDWATEIRRVLREDGSFFLNIAATSTDPVLPHELLLRLTGGVFELQNTIHWIKSISLEGEDGTTLSRGHFKPINSKVFLNDCHEYVFHLTKSGRVKVDRLAIGVPYADKSNIERWGHTGGRDRRCRGNNWFIPYRTIWNRERQRPHPATFPVELAENCIRLHGRPNPVVLDPFLGLGSSAVAARRCEAARFVGFEIDPEYAAYARERANAPA